MLSACLEQANLYAKAYDATKFWADKTDVLIAAVQYEDKRESMSGGKLITRSGVRGA
jgi:hypothetical protein